MHPLFRLPLASCVLLGLWLWSGTGNAAPAVRPNIVLIIADDLGWNDCGPFGDRTARTPNLDRLAREGMRFDRAFVTASSCSPSRASMLTGRYPHNTDAEQLHWPLPKSQVTFSEKLMAAGYWTAAAGKWHLGPEVRDRFNVVHEAGSGGFQLPADAKAGQPVAKIKQAKDESGCANWLPTMHEIPKNRPFFLWLASFDPHRDYEENCIPQPHKPEEIIVPPELPDTPAVRKDLALYHDEITRLDGYVGQVLDELEAQGVASNTIVAFISDNGRPFARAKTSTYDSGIKTPLIIRWPGHIQPGATCASLVSSMDLAPTFLTIAGVPIPPSVQGVDFSKLFADPAAKVRDYIFAEHNWHDYAAYGRAVRSARFKYIRNYDANLPNTPPADAVRSISFQSMREQRDLGKLTPLQASVFGHPRPKEELFDTEADPTEAHNLADDPKYADTLKQMQTELANWEKSTKDVPMKKLSPDEFDRETGEPLPNRVRPRPSKQQLLDAEKIIPSI